MYSSRWKRSRSPCPEAGTGGEDEEDSWSARFSKPRRGDAIARRTEGGSCRKLPSTVAGSSSISTRPTGTSVSEMFARSFDPLLGRKTYDIFAAPLGPMFGGGRSDRSQWSIRITKYIATRKPRT